MSWCDRVRPPFSLSFFFHHKPGQKADSETSTPMTQGDAEFAKALEPAVDIAPMRRMGTAQEIADACLFLCSSKATFIQGHALVSLSSLKCERLGLMLMLNRLSMVDM